MRQFFFYLISFMLLFQNCEYEQLHRLLEINFSYNADGCTLQFKIPDDLEGTFEWDFGDGTFSTERNPIHEYQASGDYNVQLTFTNKEGTGRYLQMVSTASNIVKDSEGNVYRTVTIGEQTWMAENLRSTKCADGSLIPLVENGNNLQQAAYSWPNDNREIAISKKYGALYNFHAVEECNICPEGWHVPTVSEVTALRSTLGTNSASKLRTNDLNQWINDTPLSSNWIDGELSDKCLQDKPNLNHEMDHKKATALHFDGIDDEVNLGDVEEMDFGINEFSIELWIKTTSNAKVRSLISKRSICECSNFWNLVLHENGTVYFEIAGAGCTGIHFAITNLKVNDGNWHHIAAVREKSELKIYVDGQLSGSQLSAIEVNLTNNDEVRIGSSGCVDQQLGLSFEGAMDDLRIWNKALSKAEIVERKGCELKGDESNLIAYYPFNQGISNVENPTENLLIDFTNNNYDGNLLNFSLLKTTNETGWSALPVGLRAPVSENYFQNSGAAAYFWTSDVSTERPSNSNFYFLLGNQPDLKLDGGDKGYGLSVRCLKDR